MFKTRMSTRFLVSAIGAIALQPLVAGEPTASAPPAQSISEWKAPQTPNPAGATPPARSISEWKATASPTPADSTLPAKSIGEWKTPPSPTPAPCSTVPTNAALPAPPAANPPVVPTVSAAPPTRPLTISFKSTLRRGSLVVMLDDVPIFNEKFEKSPLIISQTTTWDPLQVAAGTHRLSAKVFGTKKTYFSRAYDLTLSSTKGATLRFVMRGDKLTVEL